MALHADADADADAFAAGALVLQRWLGIWYMARVVAVSSTASGEAPALRLHVLGESDAADKWLRADSPLLRALDELPARDLGVGALPTRGDHVQLLVTDRALRRHRPSRCNDGGDDAVALVGVVRDVLMPRDASVVDVALPTDGEAEAEAASEIAHTWLPRRVHVGNGYLRIISAETFEAQRQRLRRRLETDN